MTHVTRSTTRLVLRAAVAALVSAVAATPASAQVWRGWTAYWENDSFQRPITGSDQAYTNGVRFSAVRNPQDNPGWLDDFGRAWRNTWLVRDGFSDAQTLPVLSVVVGQNFFTPTVITDFRVDTLDRPYAGLLYLGARADLTEYEDSVGGGLTWTLQHSAEADVGVVGPEAHGRPVQTGVHVLRTSRIPKGWHEQIGFDPLLQASYMVRGRLGNSFVDVTPHLGGMVGNPQTVAYGGATARLGINLSGFPTLLIPMNVAETGEQRPDFEFSLLAGVEGRAFAHNALLSGGLFGTDTLALPGGRWNRLVGDVRLGFSLRVVDWRVHYTWVRRSAELDGGPYGGLSHDYGSLALSYEPPFRPPAAAARSGLRKAQDAVAPAFEYFLFDAGLGFGRSDFPGQGARDGHGMHASVGWGIKGRRVVVGGEITGVGRDGPVPAPNRNHTDEFLRSLLATVRVRPFPTVPWPLPGTFDVRAGVGRGSYVFQVLAPGDGRVTTCPAGTVRDADDGPRCSASESGTATMLGASYALHVGSQVSAGVDLSWNRISLDAGRHTFFVPAFTVRYHP